MESASIPFVRLRNTLGADVGKVEHGLQELITIAQQRLNRSAPNRLVVDLTLRRARFGVQTIPLRGVRLALLAYYADAKSTACVKPELPVCGDCQACFRNPVYDEARFQEFYQQLYVGTPEQRAEGREGKLDADILMSNHSKINKTLQPLPLKIEAQRQWGGTTYGLNLDKNLIEIVRPEEPAEAPPPSHTKVHEGKRK